MRKKGVECTLTFAGCLTSVRNCPQPVPPPNGHVVYHNERSSYVMFRCDPEYELQGSRSALCMFGRWSPPPPKCVSREYVRRGTEGTTATEEIRAPEVPRTTPCPYSEKKSLTLDVRRRSAEDRHNQFDSIFGCRLPPAPRNGFAVVWRNKNRLAFYCQPGFRPTSTKHMTCYGRVWNGSPPRCLKGTDSPQDDVSLETPLHPNPCGKDYGGCAQMCIYGLQRHACTCQSGYFLNGTECIDRDECAEGKHNCEKGCVNTPGSYRCQCPDGYKLARDNKSCLDIDECQAKNGGCQEACVNHVGSFSCRCTSPGFSLAADGKTCVYTGARHQPRNPCTVNNGGCHYTCLWDGHTATCSCPAGYRFDRNVYRCVDVDECLTNNGGCQERCLNIHGSFRCYCMSTQSFLAADGKNCLYTLEKRQPHNPCDERNGGCQHNCSWNGIKVTCSCPVGYRRNQYNTCTDINECDTSNGGCQERCVNLIGSFRCKCTTAGSSLAPDGKKCVYAKVTQRPSNPCNVNNGGCSHNCTWNGRKVICSCPSGFYPYKKICLDINECRHKNGGCQHQCFNTLGSHVCICSEGYEVDPADKKKCRDVRGCSYNNGKGPCQEQCTPLPGKKQKCSCSSPGLKLAENGASCVDIDECSDGNFGCSHVCENVHGSAYCLCPSGLNLADDNKTCIALNGCSGNDGKGPCQERCTPSPNNGYSCSCISPGTELSTDGVSCDKLSVVPEDTYEYIWPSNSTGFSNSSDGIDDIEGSGMEEETPSGKQRRGSRHAGMSDRICSSQRHMRSHICTNYDGGYYCECPLGYEMTGDQRSCAGLNLADDNKTCIALNGCSGNDGKGPCQERCTPSPNNGYSCSCISPGTELSTDGVSCDKLSVVPEDTYEYIWPSNSTGFSNSSDGIDDIEGSGMEEETPSGSKDADRVTPECPIGFAPVNGTCEDINECSSGTSNLCAHICNNTIGSFRCSCREGYTLSETGTGCEGK
ncbi:fibrillin-3 [Ixodes scapularis]